MLVQGLFFLSFVLTHGSDIEFFIPYVAEFSTESFPYYDGTNEVYSKFPTPGQNIEWEAWEGGSTIVDNVVVYNYTATNGYVASLGVSN